MTDRQTSLKQWLSLKSQLYTGFTLAEVLITLGIIGIVAALTIPNLMRNFEDQQYKTAYKKAYSVASQAWASAYADETIEPKSGWVSEDSNFDNFNQFMSKFQVIETCTSSISSCWASNETSDVWYGTTTDDSAEVCFVDKSGMSWCNGRKRAYVFVDTNGLKNPNVFGEDRFPLFPCATNGTSFNGADCISNQGIPNTIKPWADITTSTVQCPNGNIHPCYYTSWLYN